MWFCVDFIWILVAYWFSRVRLLGFSLLWQQAMGLCFSSPLAEIPSRCPERPCGWMMCPHSMASCRISGSSQYRFVSDTIYRSRPGLWTLRLCLLLLSFISTILITKHPIWPQLWSLALPVAVQHLESCSADDSPCGMHSASGVTLRSKCYPKLSDLMEWSVLSSQRQGRNSSHPFPGDLLMKWNSDIPVLTAGLNL